MLSLVNPHMVHMPDFGKPHVAHMLTLESPTWLTCWYWKAPHGSHADVGKPTSFTNWHWKTPQASHANFGTPHKLHMLTLEYSTCFINMGNLDPGSQALAPRGAAKGHLALSALHEVTCAWPGTAAAAPPGPRQGAAGPQHPGGGALACRRRPRRVVPLPQVPRGASPQPESLLDRALPRVLLPLFVSDFF
jgi:hypothetical protein